MPAEKRGLAGIAKDAQKVCDAIAAVIGLEAK